MSFAQERTARSIVWSRVSSMCRRPRAMWWAIAVGAAGSQVSPRPLLPRVEGAAEPERFSLSRRGVGGGAGRGGAGVGGLVWWGRLACENGGMTKTELHELVEGLPDDTLDGAAVLLRSLADRRIDPDQAWFWTLDWLAGELEIEREAGTDPGRVYEDAESFKAALHATRSE